MRRLIFSLLLLGVYSASFAQKSEIANAKNSYAMFELLMNSKSTIDKQLDPLNKAKDATEKAIVNEKTKDNPELWAYRGIIFSAIAVVDTVNKANADASFKTAQEAIAKAKTLDTKAENKAMIDNAERNLAAVMQNKGIAAFNKSDYKGAFDALSFVSDAFPTDTTHSFNTALAAQNAKLGDKAAIYLKRTLDNGAKNPGIYQTLSRIQVEKGDTTAALASIEQGLAKHPGNLPLMLDEINIYLNRGKASQITGKLEAATVKDPSNKTLFYILGFAQQSAKNTDKAVESYKKAITLDPNYFEPNYQLGIMNIDKANEFVAIMKKIPGNKQKEYEAVNVKFLAELDKALPYLEKAHEINPKDKNTLITLREIYVKKNKMDKASAMKKQLDELQ